MQQPIIVEGKIQITKLKMMENLMKKSINIGKKEDNNA
jgi:hypothetical protein